MCPELAVAVVPSRVARLHIPLIITSVQSTELADRGTERRRRCIDANVNDSLALVATLPTACGPLVTTSAEQEGALRHACRCVTAVSAWFTPVACSPGYLEIR